MSYKHIDLYGKGHGNVFLSTGEFKFDSIKGDVLALREIADMHTLPKFAFECIKHNIKPLCGVAFLIKTPKDCLIDTIEIVCYPEDDEGCDELKFLCIRSKHGVISHDDFCKFSNHIQVGINTVYDERVLLVIENVLEFVLMPDFIIIDSFVNDWRCWEHAKTLIEDKKILFCLGNFSSNKSDEELLEECESFGDKAYEYLVENPRKITDRISGNIKFDVAFLEEYKYRLSLVEKSDYIRWYRNQDIKY